jgi:V/A-type H+-transporting ATPase subunit I
MSEHATTPPVAAQGLDQLFSRVRQMEPGGDLEGLLAKAHFEPHRLPPFRADDAAEGIDGQLRRETGAVAAQLERSATEEARLRDEHRGLILEAATVLARAAVFVECESVLEGRVPVACLNGWVACDRVDELRAALAAEVPNPVALVEQPPTEHVAEPIPPSDVVMPWIFQPGVKLVSLYGLPGYNELNPTLIIAATTPLLFGMMFGDVGHGLLLLIASFALRRWLGATLPPRP